MDQREKNSDLLSYIRNIQPFFGGTLGEIGMEALDEGLPIIPPEMARFLSVLLAIKPPKNVLEIGCCIGFSSALMLTRLQRGGRITTIDRYDCMIERARKNFKLLGAEDKITLIEGHAQEILPLLNPGFDFIFIDASKGQYPEFLKQALRLLDVGGFMIFDDIFQNGGVLGDSLSVPRRQRTIHKRMNYFLHTITHTDGLETSLIPLGDGIALCVKTKADIDFTN